MRLFSGLLGRLGVGFLNSEVGFGVSEVGFQKSEVGFGNSGGGYRSTLARISRDPGADMAVSQPGCWVIRGRIWRYPSQDVG